MHRSILALVAFLLLVAGRESAKAQAYGLNSRPNVGAYLDGVMPPQPPVLATNWSTVVAFPNLTFLNPLGVLPMPGTTKLVVWEREGRIYHFENTPAVAAKTLIVDFSSFCQGWDDSGLLGVAFHPQFDLSGTTGNRYLYVWYNRTRPGVAVVGSPTARPNAGQDTINRLSRFTLDANGVAVAGSEHVIIEQYDSSVWHNGGGMFFHPVNGFLYITNGDDADGANNQRINTSLFSGVLRIDVDRLGGNISHPPTRRAVNENSPNWPQYFIPNDNPFVGVPNVLEEFFAIGLRSPHRMTIDPPTGRIFIGDVGAGSREEISVIEPGDPAPLNLQWDRIEGYNGDLTGTYIGNNKRPIIDYQRGEGNAVIGGYVYRGAAFPELVGKYIFGDNGSNRIWALDESTLTATTPASKVLLTTLPKGSGPNSGNDYTGLGSFGIDAQGELYLCQLSSTAGRIYKLARGGPAPTTPLPTLLSQTGVFSNLPALTPSAKLLPYNLNAPFWSDSALKSRWATIPNGTTVGFTPTGEWSFPTGSVMVKHFDLPTDDTNPAVRKRLETRLLVKMASGAVYGATYKWRADNTDADLLDAAVTENIPVAIAAPGGFTGVDVGNPAQAGSTTPSGNLLTISAGGTDIWGNADQFHFAHQQRTGDFDLWVRIESLTQADLYTKAGLMARESLNPGSRHVFALAFPSNATRNNNVGGYEFQSRAATNGVSTAIYPAVPQPRVSYPGGWIRLQRTGDTFISYSSVDGASWREFARTTLALPATVFFGPAVTAHSGAVKTTAKIWLQDTRLQAWYFPSRQDCVSCHTTPSGGFLGLKTRQLNKDLLYPSTGVNDNQLRTWAHVGLFTNAPQESEIPNLDQLAPLTDTNASLEKRARSYFDSNCASCHRPGGVQSFWDARFDTPLAQQGIIYGQVANTLGILGGKVVVPQDLNRSILHQRVNRVGVNQMPPIARNQIDHGAVALLADWIAGLAPNSPPIVSLTTPLAESTYVRVASVPFSATASDPDGITGVDYFNGATLLGSASAPPFAFTWSNPPAGDFSVTAVARDGFGNSAESSPVTVHLVNPPVTFQAFVNFQLGTAAVPAGYLKDDGVPYGLRSGGYTYGWSRDNTADSRDRNSPNAPDQRYDTLIHMQKGHVDGSTSSFWEIAVPNGYYDVRVVAGDPDNLDGFMAVSAEGTTVVAGAQSTSQRFLDATVSVTVSDGRLTLAPGPGAVNTKICFTEITRITIPPSVALTGLPTNPAFVHTDTVTLTASAADSDGNVARVEFWDGDVKLGEDFGAPYMWTWAGPLTAGFHNLRTVAYDNDGRTTNSAVISVNVLPLKLDRASPVWQPGPPPVLQLQLQTTLPAGRAYVIEWTEDFVTWTPVQTGNASAAPLDISTSTSDPRRFYRLRLP